MSKTKKIAIGAAIAVVVIILVVVGVLKNSGSTPAFGGGPVFDVNTVQIQKGDISSSVSANGVIEEIDKAEVYFDTPLKVTKLLVQNNQRVTKGQKLVELDMDSLNSQLEQLKASVAIQQLARDAASSEADLVRADNAVKSAQRALDDSRKTYASNKDLYDASAISKSELDLSEKAVSEAEMALENAKTAYEAAASARSNNLETPDANLKVTELKISDLETQLKKAADEMYSPMDGVVTEVNVVEGAFTNNLQPAFRIINPDRLRARVNVSEFNSKNVTVGDIVNITGDAIDKSESIKGKVESVASQAKKNQTNSGVETVIEVLISIDSPSKALKPGLNISAEIVTQEKKGIVIAPQEIFVEDKDGNKSAFVVDSKSNMISQRKVTLGINSDMDVEVLEGLNEGDRVVVDPQPALKDKARVRVTDDGQK